MGTLTEKMQYIAGTKAAIRAAIEDKGVNISDSDTFRAYAGKVGDIEGGTAVAEYAWSDNLDEVSFPREALSDGYAGFFSGTSNETFENMQSYLQNNEVAFWGSYADSWKVCQNSEVWANAPMANTNFAFAFKDPVYPQEFHSRIGSTEWKLYATNDWNAFCACLQNISTDGMTALIANGEATNVEGGVDNNISSQTAYKYYVFKTFYNWSYVYNIALKVITGNVKCSLSSANMTPECRTFPKDYMRFVTQPYRTGNDVIESQTLTMKPYADGGNLIDYTDDGEAVKLEMYLLHPTGTEVSEIRDFVQPALTANGTIGGTAFAVAADSEVDVNRPAWKAFDGNKVLTSTSTDQWHSGSGQPHWIKFYNPHSLQVSKITVFNGANNVLPLAWKFEYSDDNSDWTTLTSGTNSELTQNGEWSFDVTDSGWHKYYRFYTTSGSGSDSGYLGLTEIEITALEKKEWVSDSYEYVLAEDDTFSLPTGFDSKTKVAVLDIPAHIYNDNGEWKMGGEDDE